MAIKKIFKCRIPNSNFVLASGKNIPFTGGRYITDDPYEIKELMKEIGEEGSDKSKHPHLYVDTKESQIDTTLQDRINAAKAKAVAEVLKEYETQNGVLIGGTASLPQETVVVTETAKVDVDPVTGLMVTQVESSKEEVKVVTPALPESAAAKLLAMRAANVGIASSAGNPMIASSGT